MKAKVVLVKGDVEKTILIEDKCITTTTEFKTQYDAETVYGSTKLHFKKRGWRRKAAVISKIEIVGSIRKAVSFLGYRVNNDGTVGE